MRTMESMPANKQVKIASETLFIYAPMAHRLGLYNIKTEMEDLSLKYTEPEVFRDISMKMKAIKADEIRYLKRFSSPIKTALKTEGLQFNIKERTKSIYSIRRKMVNQGVTFDEVYDKFAIRIIIDVPLEQEKAACWKAYSIVTDFYRPNPDRLRDWISSPKSNGYESLHITVMGPDGHWVEVQIRSSRMDVNAELGLASHWKYKDDEVADNKLDGWLKKVREVLENPDINALEFVDDFKFNLFSDDIFVFTPKGELKTLPKGSSPLDFSFDIHTDIGLSTLGAKVNGKLVQLNYKLKSGDQVEIITSAKQKPREEWLNYVVTSKARTKIRSSLREERNIVAERGKEILIRKLGFLRIKFSPQIETELTNFLKLRDSLELFYQAGLGLLDNQDLKQFARDRSGGIRKYFRDKLRRPVTPKKEFKDTTVLNEQVHLVFGSEDQELDYTLSPCCNPIQGDDVFGFITSTEGIKVHRKDCPNAIAMQSRFASRVIKARWVSNEVQEFVAVININGIDTVGLVNKITQIISNDLNVNIRSLNINGDGGIFEGSITVMVRNKIHLQNVMNEIRKVEGIQEVDRHFKK
jgi:GTP pyrophosphokinase